MRSRLDLHRQAGGCRSRCSALNGFVIGLFVSMVGGLSVIEEALSVRVELAEVLAGPTITTWAVPIGQVCGFGVDSTRTRRQRIG